MDNTVKEYERYTSLENSIYGTWYKQWGELLYQARQINRLTLLQVAAKLKENVLTTDLREAGKFAPDEGDQPEELVREAYGIHPNTELWYEYDSAREQAVAIHSMTHKRSIKQYSWRAYIAGPYRGAVEKNCQVADSAGRLLARYGFAPFIPHNNTKNWDALLPVDDFMRIDCNVSSSSC